MESLKPNPLLPLLERQGWILLDGGLATALEVRGFQLDSALWSAELLMSAPDAVRETHVAWLHAGADCITTASYQASLSGFAARGLETADGEALLTLATTLACEARDAVRPDALVAASVGPYGAALADGSEYDGRYGVTDHVLDDFHRRRLTVLAASGADLLGFETIPSGREATVLLNLLDEHPGTWAWMSLGCRDGRSLWDGTPVEEVAEACGSHSGVAAVGVNCTAPRHVPELVARMASVCTLPLLAYPNSGEVYDADTGRWSGAGGDADPLRRGEAPGWMAGVLGALDAGARVVGGCCRIGPARITELRTALAGGDWGWPPIHQRRDP